MEQAAMQKTKLTSMAGSTYSGTTPAGVTAFWGLFV
jgi:hypothetical protein